MVETKAIKVHSEQQSDNKISWEEFQERYLSREDQFKYEWVNGEVLQIKRDMHSKQFFIQNILIELLYSLKAEDADNNWQLIAEGDAFFDNNHRRPDIAFYTLEQIQIARTGQNVVPKFVIEVISSNDQMQLVHQKMEDYYAAEVDVVWHVLPKVEQVHVYNGRKMEVKKGNEICSANQIITGFELSVNDIFS